MKMLTAIKNLRKGDVVRLFDDAWGDALVVRVEHDAEFPPQAVLWRPHLHIGDESYDTQPSTQYEIFRIGGAPVDVVRRQSWA